MFQKLIARSVLKKIHSFRGIDGWLSDEEATGLYLTARKLSRNAVVVEIGSWQGKSTYCIAKGLRSGKVFAIDPFNADSGKDEGSRQEYADKKGDNDLLNGFRTKMEQLRVMEKIVVKQGYSHQFHQDFDKIDFLFIDGDHSKEGCKSDFELYAPKILNGGFIAFHDFYPDRKDLGPTYVIDHFVLKAGDFAFVGQYDSLWIGQKK